MSDDLFVIAKDRGWKISAEFALMQAFPNATVQVVLEADFLADGFEDGPKGQMLIEKIPDPDYSGLIEDTRKGWFRNTFRRGARKPDLSAT